MTPEKVFVELRDRIDDIKKSHEIGDPKMLKYHIDRATAVYRSNILLLRMLGDIVVAAVKEELDRVKDPKFMEKEVARAKFNSLFRG